MKPANQKATAFTHVIVPWKIKTSLCTWWNICSFKGVYIFLLFFNFNFIFLRALTTSPFLHLFLSLSNYRDLFSDERTEQNLHLSIFFFPSPLFFSPLFFFFLNFPTWRYVLMPAICISLLCIANGVLELWQLWAGNTCEQQYADRPLSGI